MKLVSFMRPHGYVLGVVTSRGILDVEVAKRRLNFDDVPTTIDQVFAADSSKSLEKLAALVDKAIAENPSPSELLDEASVTLGPCVPATNKVICVGTNYRKHALESNMPIPTVPVLFSKFSNALCGHGAEVRIPAGLGDAAQCDYEAEMALVIGKSGKDIAQSDALDYVAGYCNANDVSSRQLQFTTTQWLLGKTCDGFCPIGPYLVTSDEVADPNYLDIRCYLNGEQRQNSNTSDMIFDCQSIISYISRYVTLSPGDVILTGTPEGVLLGLPEGERFWLKSGDTVVVEVEGLGRLENRIV